MRMLPSVPRRLLCAVAMAGRTPACSATRMRSGELRRVLEATTMKEYP